MPICLRLFVLMAALIALPAATASAQEDFSGTTYITPYPEGDLYRLQVYGDAFANGLLDGLVDALSGDTRLQIQRKHRSLPGLIRPDLEDELKAEDANRDPLHIAVVMVGVNDRYNIRISTRDRFVVGTDEWRDEYGRRVDRVIRTLKKRGAAVYWVGQPIMRRPDANEPAQVDHVFAGQMGPETIHFLESIILNRPVMVTPESARVVMEVYSAADLSAERNEPIDLPLSNQSLAGIAEIVAARR